MISLEAVLMILWIACYGICCVSTVVEFENVLCPQDCWNTDPSRLHINCYHYFMLCDLHSLVVVGKYVCLFWACDCFFVPIVLSSLWLCSGLKRILKNREVMVKERVADWAMGEAFAFGSLLMDGEEQQLFLINSFARSLTYSVKG